MRDLTGRGPSFLHHEMPCQVGSVLPSEHVLRCSLKRQGLSGSEPTSRSCPGLLGIRGLMTESRRAWCWIGKYDGRVVPTRMPRDSSRYLPSSSRSLGGGDSSPFSSLGVAGSPCSAWLVMPEREDLAEERNGLAEMVYWLR